MDFSWLPDLFGKLLGIFNPLKAITHWRIWAELKNWYERFKKWRDWYNQHVIQPLAQMQKLQRQLFDQLFSPFLSLIDHLRQLTGIIGIFNHKLANRLNYMFLRVESYLLVPMNAITSRTNALGFAIQSILTPLGYLDRGTLLNSIWRDAALVREILHNPFEQHPPAATLPTGPTVNDKVAWAQQYLNSDTGPYADRVDQMILTYRTLKAGG